MPDFGEVMERDLRAHLRGEASAIRTPDDLVSQILASVPAEREAAALDTKIRSSLRLDAERARVPSDMPARVRGILRQPSTGRGLGRLALIPSLAAVIALAVFVVSSLRQADDGNEALTAQQVLSRAVGAANDPESVGLESYSGTLTIETAPAIQSATDPGRLELKVWFGAPDLYRQDAVLQAPAANDTLSALKIVSRGEMAWYYDDAAGAYYSAVGGVLDADQSQRSQRLARLVPGQRADYLEDLLQQLAGAPASDIALSEGRIAGRDAFVIDAADVELDCPAGVCPARSDVRLWLDQQYLVPLRSEVEVQQGDGLEVIAFSDVTFNARLDEALFAFAPEAPEAPLAYTIVIPEGNLPAGVVVPRELPAGYGFADASSEERARSSPAGPLSYRLTNSRGGYIEVEQRAASPPNDDELDAFPALTGGGIGEGRATLQDGDQQITVTANQLSEEELLRLLESMTPTLDDLDGDGVP